MSGFSDEPTKAGEGHCEYGTPPFMEARLDPRFQVETMGIATRKGVREIPVEFSMSIAKVEGVEYAYMRDDNGARSRLPLRELEGLLAHAKLVYRKSQAVIDEARDADMRADVKRAGGVVEGEE